MTKDELISAIESAFDGVPRPALLTLHVAEAHDGYDYGNDKAHRARDHVGRWQDLPSEHIERCQCALSHVDAVGMRYYLPAYMRWYLRNMESERVTTDHTLYSLDHHRNDPKLAEYHRQRFADFTRQELAACARFVAFCAEADDNVTDTGFARQQLERYWHQFLA